MYKKIPDMQVAAVQPLINAHNEWDPLKEVIVGVAEHSMFPSEDKRVIHAIYGDKYAQEFRPNNPFPQDILSSACKELEKFVSVLKGYGVTVVRCEKIDWSKPKTSGYTGAFPRDALLVAANRMIEAPMAFKCRNNEHLAYEKIFNRYSAKDSHSQVIRRPALPKNDNLLDGGKKVYPFVINNSRPAFDAADFIKIGNNTIVGQLSNVTNPAGVELLRSQLLGSKIKVVIIDGITDSHCMHIDATIMPLRQNLMLYNPNNVTPEVLGKVDALKGWTFIAAPTPSSRRFPPLFCSSPWLNMNILVLDPHCVVVEEKDDELCALLESHSFRTIRLPFQNVHTLGGSFHCATVDVRREAATTTLDVPVTPLPLPIAGPTLCLAHALKSLDTLTCGLGSVLGRQSGHIRLPAATAGVAEEMRQADKDALVSW